MKEKEVRQEVFRLAKSLGFFPVTQTDTQICPKCFTRIKPPIGRPDILWLNPTKPGVVSEIKAIPENAKTFAFSSISEEQRRWLSWWTEAGGLAYLGLGTLVPRHRRLWLVPWHHWLEIEAALTPYQDSIPITVAKHMRIAVQDQKLDLDHLAAPFECTKTVGGWTIYDRSST